MTCSEEPKPTLIGYVRDEQDVLLRALDSYPNNLDAAIEGGLDFTEIVALATGSSINAVLSARYYIESRAEVHVDIQEPYNYLHYERRKPSGQLVLGVSQSGQSTSTIGALQALRGDNRTIAVTSMPESEISGCCDATIDILSGKERVGYVTLGFNATVLALMLFGLRLGVKKGIVSADEERRELREFKAVVSRLNEAIELTESFFKRNANELGAAHRFMSVAYGPAFGTAQEMQTKFCETVRVPSQGIDLEAFMHGPYLEMQPDYRLFFLETPAASDVKEKMALLKEYESDVTPYIYTISVDGRKGRSRRDLVLPAVADEMKVPLLLVIPFQVLCWYISRERGIDITHRIFTDFAQRCKSKTVVQDYV